MDRLHNIPLNDTYDGELFIHAAQILCQCIPVQDTESPALWIHHAFDTREQQERLRGHNPSKPWATVREMLNQKDEIELAKEIGYYVIQPPAEDGTVAFKLCHPSEPSQYPWRETEEEAWEDL